MSMQLAHGAEPYGRGRRGIGSCIGFNDFSLVSFALVPSLVSLVLTSVSLVLSLGSLVLHWFRRFSGVARGRGGR